MSPPTLPRPDALFETTNMLNSGAIPPQSLDVRPGYLQQLHHQSSLFNTPSPRSQMVTPSKGAGGDLVNGMNGDDRPKHSTNFVSRKIYSNHV